MTPTYDANGNLTFDGTNTLGYDAENRLVSASATGMTASYAFDGRGRRKSKTVNGTTTVFVTDADNREVLEYDGSTGAVQRWYAYSLGPNAVLGQMDVIATARSTPVSDLLGSIIGSMDAGTGTLSIFGYQPHGSSASTPSPFAYTGQRNDAETGLYYYRARHYSSRWGRFLQVDPVGYSTGPHLYGYVSNDPLNGTDPTGLFVTRTWNSFRDAMALTGEAVGAGLENYARQEFKMMDSLGGPAGYAAAQVGPLAVGIGVMAAPALLATGTTAGGALLPIAEAALYYGRIQTIAGYEVGYSAGLVGTTYNVNMWALYAKPGESLGLFALNNFFRAQAAASGATSISIIGASIINPSLANMSTALASRLGYSVSQINPSTIWLRSGL
ncbi:MAG: RHS repeat-associated core domain-containing protein [Reyranella sp.]|uniref:RHS repeat-associated core domain-containing protein n=1 Tax=Reyranella sp. TaxID=1929291 RepID=UPI001AD1AEED|nr:RHS repeat-associated core domain-containing protein [Reyranella sp.]MBN9088418.1 RHS repeat-associated core domain-containing protein [Reyranella sp.]